MFTLIAGINLLGSTYYVEIPEYIRNLFDCDLDVINHINTESTLIYFDGKVMQINTRIYGKQFSLIMDLKDVIDSKVIYQKDKTKKDETKRQKDRKSEERREKEKKGDEKKEKVLTGTQWLSLNDDIMTLDSVYCDMRDSPWDLDSDTDSQKVIELLMTAGDNSPYEPYGSYGIIPRHLISGATYFHGTEPVKYVWLHNLPDEKINTLKWCVNISNGILQIPNKQGIILKSSSAQVPIAGKCYAYFINGSTGCVPYKITLDKNVLSIKSHPRRMGPTHMHGTVYKYRLGYIVIFTSSRAWYMG
jgi:hypothetical protein